MKIGRCEVKNTELIFLLMGYGIGLIELGQTFRGSMFMGIGVITVVLGMVNMWQFSKEKA